MIKKFLTLCVTAGCLCLTSASVFADNGAVGGAVSNIVDAGRDVADGIVRAGDDIIGDRNDSLGGTTANGAAGTTAGSTAGGTSDGTVIDNSGVNAIGDTTDTTTDTTTGTTDTDTNATSPNADNPTTGVTVGYAEITAVLAAMGVAISSIRRKHS